jgi:hypothetical protein
VLSTLLILALLPAVFAVVACLLFGALMFMTSALTARTPKPALADPDRITVEHVAEAIEAAARREGPADRTLSRP